MPFGRTFADLFAKILGLQLISKLRLSRDVGLELFDKFTCIIRKVVETFLLEVVEPRERGRRWIDRLSLGLERVEAVGLRLLLLWLRAAAK